MRQVVLAVVVLLAALPAAARNGGLYLELAPSWGFFFTDELIIEDGDDNNGSFPNPGFTPQLKLGVNLFGFGGAEGDIAAFGWDMGDVERGGGGFVGGDVRITPLEFLTFVIPETVEIPSLVPKGPVNWHNRPFDVGFYMGGGWSLVGEDYAYQGGYFKWGFDAKFFITPQLAVGIDIPFRHTLYQPFRYVDFNHSTGFCTEHDQAFGYSGDQRVDVEPNANRNVYKPFEVSTRDIKSKCTEPAAGGMFFAPAVTIAGVFDFGI